MVWESKMSMGRAIDIQSYRHIAIAIGRYWCRGWQPANSAGEDGTDVEDVLDTIDVMWDVTASHSSRVANNAYATNTAVAKGSNDNDYHRARIVSTEWHKWMKVDSDSLAQADHLALSDSKDKSHGSHGRGPSLGLGQPPMKRLALHSTIQRRNKV